MATRWSRDSARLLHTYLSVVWALKIDCAGARNHGDIFSEPKARQDECVDSCTGYNCCRYGSAMMEIPRLLSAVLGLARVMAAVHIHFTVNTTPLGKKVAHKKLRLKLPGK